MGRAIALGLVGCGATQEVPGPAPRRPARPRPLVRAFGAVSGRAFEGGAWVGRLAAVNRRYGAWGAAYLVGLLMLADRAVSSEGR